MIETEWMREHRLAEEKRQREHKKFMQELAEWKQKEKERQRKEEEIQQIIQADLRYQNASGYIDKCYIEYQIRLKLASIYGMPRREDYLPWESPLWDRPLYDPNH